MNPYNNDTKDSNLTNSTASEEKHDRRLAITNPRLSFAELEKPDEKEKKKVEKDDKEFDDDHKNDKKLKKKDSNETDSEGPSFEEMFHNMTFAVNKTLNKGWPIRRDDGFPYQE